MKDDAFTVQSLKTPRGMRQLWCKICKNHGRNGEQELNFAHTRVVVVKKVREYEYTMVDGTNKPRYLKTVW